jgi:hypothetical protein
VHRGPPDPVEDVPSDAAAFKAVARRSRRTTAAVVIAGLAVLAIALLTKQGPSVVVVPTAAVAPQASPALAAPTSNAPTGSPRPSPTPGAPSRNPTVTPHPTFVAIPAGTGETLLTPAGPTRVRLRVSLPDGWEKASDGMYVKSKGAAPAGMSLGVWSIQDVEVFPCRWSSQVFADPSLMGTAEGQAEALSEWWGQDPSKPPYSNSAIAPAVIKPEPTTIQGYPAQYLEVLILTAFDFSACDGGQLVLWDTASGDVRYGLGGGELHRLLVVDVDGGVIVIDAASYSGTSAADKVELQAMIDSIQIEP